MHLFRYTKTILLSFAVIGISTLNHTAWSATTIAVSQPTLITPKPIELPVDGADTPQLSAVQIRAKNEELAAANTFMIAFYKPNYVMPYYYTGSPYNSVYLGQTPNDEKLTRDEIKYQLSFKVPLWKNIFGYHSTLFMGYTQLSYWQAYNEEAFFRSTDYEPDLFLTNQIDLRLYKNFMLNFVNIGAEHQSNGFGNTLERSWNRIYLEGVASTGNFMVSVKPWYIIHDITWRQHNPNIGSYLGYMQLLFAYKMDKTVLNFRTYGLGVHGGSRTSAELSLSFPLSSYINGYFQVFSGYGQSLIEYDHRTNSAGVGISLSNWI